MPSRRKLKKQIKAKTNLLIEDAFIESINGGEKEAEKMDTIIDNVIDERLDMLSKVSQYPNNGKRSEVKSHFSSVKKDLEEKSNEFSKKIGRVG